MTKMQKQNKSVRGKIFLHSTIYVYICICIFSFFSSLTSQYLENYCPDSFDYPSGTYLERRLNTTQAPNWQPSKLHPFISLTDLSIVITFVVQTSPASQWLVIQKDNKTADQALIIFWYQLLLILQLLSCRMLFYY